MNYDGWKTNDPNEKEPCPPDASRVKCPDCKLIGFWKDGPVTQDIMGIKFSYSCQGVKKDHNNYYYVCENRMEIYGK